MCSRDMAPAALLLNRANPIMVQGAAFAGLPFIDRFEVDITRSLRTGDTVIVRPHEGLVRIVDPPREGENATAAALRTGNESLRKSWVGSRGVDR